MAEDQFDLVPNKKAKSDVWSNFLLKRDKKSLTTTDGIAICRHCDVAVKNCGGTTNLTTHMIRHHPKLNTTAKAKVNPGISIASQPEVKVKANKQSTLPKVLNTKYPFNSDRSMAITNSIAQYISDDLRPLSVVEGSGFKKMIKTLDPRYSIPGRTYFSQTAIPRMYEDTVSKVKSSLSNAKSVALTTDGWTSRATVSYVTITSVHITPDWKLQNFVLQTRAMPESHTGSNIAKVVSEAISEWGIPNCPPLVTDNAANMTVAAQELQSKPHIGCFAHCLNLAAQKALKINVVSRILGRVRRIVSFFHRSTTAAALLKSKINVIGSKDLKLIQDVSTRWNSAADMLERYLILQPAIYATFLSKELNKDTEITILNEADTVLAEDIKECLLPLRDITVAICTEKTPTVSIMLPLIDKIKKIMTVNDADSSITKQIKQAVLDNISTRYKSQELQEFIEECTVLDPRFKCYFDSEKLYNTYHRLALLCSAGQPITVKIEPTHQDHHAPLTVVETPQLPQLPQLPTPMDVDQPTSIDNLQPENSKEKLSVLTAKRGGLADILGDVVIVKQDKGKKTCLERANDEIDKYKATPQISLQDDPLLWWKHNSIYFPLLANLAKSRLCIPATSVPSERIFSTAGDIVTAQRAALNPDMVDKLIFLKKNSEF